ncbi:GNAT family N-acetyltransferase [Thomasclavelia sp.]
MKIRKATIKDLDEITKIEEICFPETEAASKECFRNRLLVYPDYFWLLEENNKIVTFINGMVTDEETINDKMFENPNLHNSKGDWQAIFGVNTLPEYRNRGLAKILMRKVIEDARKQKRKGCILTCKYSLIPYYEKFGYVNKGVSNSVHGGAIWYDMILEFKNE